MRLSILKGGKNSRLVVAAQADRAAFGPDPGDPGHGAEDAWQAMRLVRKAARATIPWYKRLLWYVDPRPFWRER